MSATNIIAYFHHSKKIWILIPILSISIPAITHIIYILVNIQPKIGKFFKAKTIFEYKDDFYEINWRYKTAKLLIKGNKNKIIRPSIVCNDQIIDVEEFDYFCLCKYLENSLVLRNSNFQTPNYLIKKITIDCDWQYLDFERLTQNCQNLKTIEVTKRCSRFFSCGNKIYLRRNMELIFVEKNSRHLVINESCTSIRKNAVESCQFLCYIKFPPSVVYIGENSFKNCVNLRNITFSENSQIINIEPCAFYNTGLRYVIFPRSLEKIGQSAFTSCYKLRKVVFPKGSNLNFCCLGAFDERTSLIIKIPSSIKHSFQRFILDIDD